MNQDLIVKKFNEKLKNEGRSKKWFVKTYISEEKKDYQYFCFQIAGWKPEINENFIEAIQKYLEN